MWQEAFDAQMGVWRWYRTGGAAEWLGGLYQEAIEQTNAEFRKTLALMYDGEMGRLIDCDPIFVSAEMCQVVDAARHSFEPEPLQLTDIMTPRGFLYFEEPLTIPDRHGRPLEIRAVAWSQQYSIEAGDREKLDERVNAFVERSEAGESFGPRFVASEMDAMVADGLIEPHGLLVAIYADRETYIENAARRNTDDPEQHARMVASMVKSTEGTPLVTVHVAPWQYGMTFEGNEVDEQGEPTGARDWWQLLQTTFRLMQQRMAHKGYERPHRARRREGARLGFRPDTEVVVVRLRREASETEPEEGGEANYSHRFIVSGHWRNQWYPSEKLHRQIWISPYVKGPEDKPLIVRPRRVYQWTR
jgi:hypothetical protein